MENKPVIVNNQVSIQEERLAKIQEISKVLYDINQVVHYPFPDSKLEEWSAHLIRLDPKFEINDLILVMDDFMLGRREFDKDRGITNIFRELKYIQQEREGLELRKQFYGEDQA